MLMLHLSIVAVQRKQALCSISASGTAPHTLLVG